MVRHLGRIKAARFHNPAFDIAEGSAELHSAVIARLDVDRAIQHSRDSSA